MQQLVIIGLAVSLCTLAVFMYDTIDYRCPEPALRVRISADPGIFSWIGIGSVICPPLTPCRRPRSTPPHSTEHFPRRLPSVSFTFVVLCESKCFNNNRYTSSVEMPRRVEARPRVIVRGAAVTLPAGGMLVLGAELSPATSGRAPGLIATRKVEAGD